MVRAILAAAALALGAPVLADTPPPGTQAQVETLLAAAPKGTRFGLLVVDDAGKVIAAVNPDQRFIPASNTKMFTTAAAYALLPGMDQPDAAGGTQVALGSAKGNAPRDVILTGRGDARMSSAADCSVDCLGTLADAVAARTKVVGDVIGDDSRFADEGWSPGMSWNNIQTEDGTAAGALNLDDNQLKVTAIPGAPGKAPVVAVSPYYLLANEALTGAAGSKPSLALERAPGTNRLRIYGNLPADSKEWHQWVGIDDPALYAAWVFMRMLQARGVEVVGEPHARHRGTSLADRPCGDCTIIRTSEDGQPIVAALTPPPLAADVIVINKISQNLHAQVLFRRLGYVSGNGSSDWSVKAEQDLFALAGIPREGYDFSDGSGMSTYNRVSPRAAVALLRWIDTQPWSKAWQASLPMAGVDGTLRNRFKGTPLANNLIAKTGTLNATNALSGTFRAASGRRLTFAFFANDVPDGQSALAAMEAVLLAVAAAN